MSNPDQENTAPQVPADDAKPPARKRAAKKAAVKKTAAKKTAAKKTAKKKVAEAAGVETPSVQKTVTPEPVMETVIVSPVAPSSPLPEVPAEKRFGRVPGGGPVVPRENPAPASAAEPQSQGGPQENNQQQSQNRDGQPRESRSKRRREKRKRRGQVQGQGQQGHHPHAGNRHDSGGEAPAERQQPLSGPKIEADGMLELAPKGFGFLRIHGKNFEQARDDVFVTPEIIRKYHLRLGQWVHGLYQNGQRGPQLVEVTSINGMTPDEASKLPHFDELKAINPNKRISFETTPERFTTRVVDIMAPVGRGQRGLIVSPPRSGKTTLLLHMAEAIREKYDEAIHLMVLLVDERPEEVTEFRRALPGAEIYASSNDEQARNHCRIAELAIERAKRLVEAGKDVFLLMDSITRLARAYNNTMGNRGRGTGSGGITIGALEVPRRLFAAARNTRGGGSLTILATALIQTNSRADEAIFMEFKGTGNMELVLDRKIAENYIYPAVDIFKSGTRREELLLPEHMLHKIHLIRRGLSGHRPVEAMERLLFFLKKFPNNPQMLLEIKG
jgi:transcription termination factor Rho